MHSSIWSTVLALSCQLPPQLRWLVNGSLRTEFWLIGCMRHQWAKHSNADTRHGLFHCRNGDASETTKEWLSVYCDNQRDCVAIELNWRHGHHIIEAFCFSPSRAAAAGIKSKSRKCFPFLLPGGVIFWKYLLIFISDANLRMNTVISLGILYIHCIEK